MFIVAVKLRIGIAWATFSSLKRRPLGKNTKAKVSVVMASINGKSWLNSSLMLSRVG